MGVTNIFCNLTNFLAQLMNNKVPWRGGREKDSHLLPNFIKALTKPIDVVLDAYTLACDYRPQCQSFIFDYSLSMFFFVCFMLDFYVVSPFMHVSKVVATLVPWRVIWPYLSPFCLHCVRRLLSSHVEVYLTLPPLQMNTNMFGRLHSVIALVSKFG